jgi:hypothetical protein
MVGVIGFFTAASAEKFKSLSLMVGENLKEILFFILLSNLPDIDMIVGYLLGGDLHLYHGRASHSLLAAVLTAFAISLAYRIRGSRIRTFLFASLLIIIHDLMDCSASTDFSKPGAGVWLFFPIQERIISSFPLFYGFRHQTFGQVASFHNLKVIAYEMFEFGIILLSVYFYKKRRYDRLENKVRGQ